MEEEYWYMRKTLRKIGGRKRVEQKDKKLFSGNRSIEKLKSKPKKSFRTTKPIVSNRKLKNRLGTKRRVF